MKNFVLEIELSLLLFETHVQCEIRIYQIFGLLLVNIALPKYHESIRKTLFMNPVLHL